MDKSHTEDSLENAKVVNTKTNKKFGKLRDKLPSDRKRLVLLGLIVLAIPLTVTLALYQQELRSRAGGFPATPATPPNPPESGVHRVFVTSASYDGNLGGLSGADAKCQASADAANLGGTWQAWLSDSQVNATNRLNHATVPYKLLNGTTVADNWADLNDGTIQNKINITEYKTTNPNYIWTATNVDGTLVPDDSSGSNSCKDWTSTEKEVYGVSGTTGTAASQWTYNVSRECSSSYHNSIYCFESSTVSDFSTPTPTKLPTPTPTNSYSVRFQGTHVDSNRAPISIPGQKVIITNMDTNQTFETVASPTWTSPVYPRGRYKVTAVPIQGYKITSNVCQNCTFHSSYETNPEGEFDSTQAPGGFDYYDIGFQYVPVTTKVILIPNADSFVRSSAPNQNFGTEANLKNDLKPDEISYMRFNLSALAGKTIKSAKLTLWTSDPTISTLNLRNADDSDWSEAGITYNKRPSFISTLTSFNARNKDVSVTIDVTNRINSKKGTKATFGIKSVADDSGAFYSRNAIDAKKRPQLAVEYY